MSDKEEKKGKIPDERAAVYLVSVFFSSFLYFF